MEQRKGYNDLANKLNWVLGILTVGGVVYVIMFAVLKFNIDEVRSLAVDVRANTQQITENKIEIKNHKAYGHAKSKFDESLTFNSTKGAR